MKNRVQQFIPKPIKQTVQKFYYFVLDSIDQLLSGRNELTPPKRMIFVGAGEFKKIGKLFLYYFIEYGGLRPNENVLDVGCGIGRKAAPLTKYLNETGSYEGFDIVDHGISWCKKKDYS